MSLLDGKYEVMSQRPLEGGGTIFDATAPDGTPLRIEWFDLAAGEEAAFERYRRLLKRLKRDGLAAVHDVIARPGATYVAWLKPENGSVPAAREELEQALAANGYEVSAADIRARGARRPGVLYGLGYDGRAAPSAAQSEPESVPVRPLRTSEPPLAALERVPLKYLSWGLTALLLLATVIVAFAAFERRVVDTIVRVPDVVGSDVQRAVDELSALRLVVDIVPFASDAPAGRVLAAEPPVGTDLRPGRLVRLTYALPAGQLAQTQAPGLVGLAYPDEVRATLTDAGLTLGEVARIAAPTPAGIVLAQTAAPGENVGAGMPIDVLVSSGPAAVQTFVPDLVGLQVDDAVELARVAGIDPSRILVDEVSSAVGFAGEVLGQSLAANVPVAQGAATLRLLVQATGPATTAVAGGAPDVVGLDEEAATELATADDWAVAITRLGSLALPAGVVVDQVPAPGLELPADTPRRLVLVVNNHPVALSDPGVRVIVREPQPREVAYAWTILPGIARTRAQVWARSLDGSRTLVATPLVEGGEVLRGTWRTSDPGPITFELLLGDIPYGDPLLVP